MKSEIIKAACGRINCDVVIKGGKIVDIFGRRIIQGDVGIKHGIIVGVGEYKGDNEIDARGMYISPGLIDSHVHIESAMVKPSEYAKAVAARGVTSIIADPHEIVNVCGEAGLRFMIEDSKNVPVDIFYMMPSCVPATPFDNAGAKIDSELTKKLIDKYELMGLGEMMNFTGVINCDKEVINKMEGVNIIDGHCPLVSGMELNGYICGGVSNDHECSNAAEALEKISKGLNILIREGSGAKNLVEIIKAITPYNIRSFAFCTDDKHIEDIIEEGTISHCINKAILLGMDAIDAITIGSYNTALMYNLGKRGAIAPNYIGDIVISSDINLQNIRYVLKEGKVIVKEGKALFEAVVGDISDVINTINLKNIANGAFDIEFSKDKMIIEIEKGSLITKGVFAESNEGLSICANIERHRASGNIGKSYIKGITINDGAIAQSIGHDSHNITVIGSDSANMEIAVNSLGKAGGIAVVHKGKVISNMTLDIGGIISAKEYNAVAREQREIIEACNIISSDASSEVLMILSFISLLVIPHIKLGDKGIFDVDKFRYL